MKKFTLDVHTGETECFGLPELMTVEIDAKRAREILRLMAIVQQYSSLGCGRAPFDHFGLGENLDVREISAWDYSTNWFEPPDADDDGISLGEQVRMDCMFIVACTEFIFYRANMKNADVICESDYISIKELREIVADEEAALRSHP